MDEFEQGPRQDQPLSPEPLKPQPLSGKERDKKGRKRSSFLKRFARFFFVIMIIATLATISFYLLPVISIFALVFLGAIHVVIVGVPTILTVGVIWLFEPFRVFAIWGFELLGKIANVPENMAQISTYFPYVVYLALIAGGASFFFALLAHLIKKDKGMVKYYVTIAICLIGVLILYIIFLNNGSQLFS